MLIDESLLMLSEKLMIKIKIFPFDADKEIYDGNYNICF